MEFRLLGPLEVIDGEREIRLGGPKQRSVLAHLLIRANQVVPTERLIDEIWGDQPPEAARNALQSYVSHLRKALGAGRIQGRPPGYALKADPDEVDALRFERLVSEGRGQLSSDPGGAARTLSEALALWRGPHSPTSSTNRRWRAKSADWTSSGSRRRRIESPPSSPPGVTPR